MVSETYWSDRYWPMYVGPDSPLQSIDSLIPRIWASKCVTVDIETAAPVGDDDEETDAGAALDFREADIVGVSICWKETEPPPELAYDPQHPFRPPNDEGPWFPSLYFPLAHKLYRNCGEDVIQFLKELLQSKKPKFTHGGFTFDGPMLKFRKQISMGRPWGDTGIMAGLWDETKPKKLKVLGEELLHLDVLEWDFKKIPFNIVAPGIGFRYACQDAHITMGLLEWFGSYFRTYYPEALPLLNQVEFPMAEIFYRMTCHGMRVNWPLLRAYQAACEEVITKGTAKARELLGKDVNFKSPKQVREAFAEVGHPIPNAQAETLAKVDHPAAKLITLVNTFSIYKSRYVDGVAKWAWSDGRVRPLFVLWEVSAKGKRAGTECVTAGTMVWTDEGLVPIETLFRPGHQPNFEAAGIELPTILNNEVVPGMASHTYLGLERKCLTITTGLGIQINTTPEHPLLTAQGWLRAEDLRPGDLVHVPLGRLPSVEGEVHVDLRPEPRKKNDYSRREPSQWPTTLTPDLARLLGYYQADGSFHDSNGTRVLRISTGAEEVLEDIQSIIQRAFGLEVQIVRSGNRVPYVATPSAVTDALIREFKLQKGAENKTIPLQVMRSPDRVIQNYLRGLLQDSTLPKDRLRVRLATANRETATWLHAWLLGRGYVCGHQVAHSRKTGHREQHYILLEGDVAMRFLRWVDPLTSKHRDYITKWAGYEKAFANPKYLTHNGVLKVPVSSVEELPGVHRVYDLHVPGTHNFISNGLVSHNTGRASARNPLVHQFPKESIRFPIDILDLSQGVHQLVEKLWNPTTDDWEYAPALNCRALLMASEGHLLVATDASQIEPRVTAALTGEPLLVNGYRSGKGIYKPAGARLFRKTEEEVHKKTREYKLAKTYILTKDYMGGAETVYGRCLAAGVTDITLEDVQRDLKRLEQEMPLVAAFPEKVVVPQLLANGYSTTIFGRRRHAPYFHVRDHRQKRQHNNFLRQSVAFQIMKQATIRIDKAIQEQNLRARLCLQVHDEDVADTPFEEVFTVAEIMEREICVDIPEFPHPVPLAAETEVGKYYGRMVDLETYRDMCKYYGGPVPDPYAYEPTYRKLKAGEKKEDKVEHAPWEDPTADLVADTPENRKKKYMAIAMDVKPCTTCAHPPFEATNHKKVGPLGKITEPVELMWLVGHPDDVDMQCNKLLSGPDGNLLKQEAYQAGLPLPPNGKALVVPALWCGAADGDGVSTTHIHHCRTFMDRVTELATPKVIVALGSIAMRSALRIREMGLEERLGWHCRQDGIWVMVTYAPRYLLRAPGYTVRFREHLALVKERMTELAREKVKA